ncbi:acetyl-CoA carboxylase biotin carboxyl carrier protein [Altererythrobacter lauratis]|uniref:Biotin carboxyl carrier protein of acetyl-CoA carboxylase n=1 Tax=Alteraurantiacibacter lauratis TaxID=2054627 RepID=A0ABV7EL55_9SPHN
MTRLTGKDIAEIAKLLDESQFSALDLTMGEFRLRIRRDGGGAGWDSADDEPTAPAPRPAPRAAPNPAPAAPAPAAPADGPAAGEVDVPAPLLGNFYAAPRPGEPPFVQVGDTVGPDTTIGIIEVMKLMNPIRAGVAGTVTALLAENGKAVEKGQALIRVKVG